MDPAAARASRGVADGFGSTSAASVHDEEVPAREGPVAQLRLDHQGRSPENRVPPRRNAPPSPPDLLLVLSRVALRHSRMDQRRPDPSNRPPVALAPAARRLPRGQPVRRGAVNLRVVPFRGGREAKSASHPASGTRSVAHPSEDVDHSAALKSSVHQFPGSE